MSNASEALEEGGTAAEKSARGIEQSYFVAAEGIRDFNARLIEMAHTNTLAALDLVREVSAAEGPSEAASLWSSHAQKQFQAMAEQSRELTALAQRLIAFAAPEGPGLPQQLQGTSRPFLRLVTP